MGGLGPGLPGPPLNPALNHLPVSKTVRGSAEGKCGLIFRYFPTRLVSHLHRLLISKLVALC